MRPLNPNRLSWWRHALAGGFACFTVVIGFTPTARAEAALLHVTVFDYAALVPAELDVILATVDRLLGEAGLRVQWARCPRVPPHPSVDRLSEAPPPDGMAIPVCRPTLEPGGLALRLLAVAPPMSNPDAPLTLGFAALDEAGTGVMATVYLDRVRRLGQASMVASGWLTGLVAAHELGHLLLGTAGHGDHGVMQPGWSVQDLRRGQVTDWRFSPDEGARLRVRASRVGAAE